MTETFEWVTFTPEEHYRLARIRTGHNFRSVDHAGDVNLRDGAWSAIAYVPFPDEPTTHATLLEAQDACELRARCSP